MEFDGEVIRLKCFLFLCQTEFHDRNEQRRMVTSFFFPGRGGEGRCAWLLVRIFSSAATAAKFAQRGRGGGG